MARDVGGELREKAPSKLRRSLLERKGLLTRHRHKKPQAEGELLPFRKAAH